MTTPTALWSSRSILATLLAAVWISASEFLRNEILFKGHWTEHYQNLGLVFPDAPINGAIWGLWSLCFAIAIRLLSTRFSLIETTALAWFMGFVLMWIAIGNMGVLPYALLVYAIPLSVLEAFVAAWMIRRVARIQAH